MTFIGYTQYQQIGKSNNYKIFKSKTTKINNCIMRIIFDELRWKVIVSCVDIGENGDHHSYFFSQYYSHYTIINFGGLTLKDFIIIWLSNLLILSVPEHFQKLIEIVETEAKYIPLSIHIHDSSISWKWSVSEFQTILVSVYPHWTGGNNPDIKLVTSL
jgi:hypothetical protein